MKREWLERVRDSVVIVLNHLLFVAVAITILDLFQVEHMMLLVWITMIIIPFLLYFIKPRTQKIVPPPLMIGLLGLLSIMETIMKINDWGFYYLVIAFLYLGIYFLYYYIKKFIIFLELNENGSVNIPEKKIFSNGIRQTFVFASGSLFVLFMTMHIDWFAKVVDWIWSIVLEILRMIFSGIETVPPAEETPTQEIQGAMSNTGDGVVYEFLPDHIKDMIRAVVIAFLFVSFILGCILVFFTIYQFLKEKVWVDKSKKKECALQMNEDIREHCGIEKIAHKNSHFFVFWNNREKIRKLYQKKMLKEKKKLVGEQEIRQLEYLTAKECCDKLAEQNLKIVYEKARYSAENVSADDVRRARKS